MEENNTSTQGKSSGSKNWIVIAVVVIALVILLIGGGYYYMNSREQKEMVENQAPIPTAVTQESGATTAPQTSSSYQDGTYTANGEYAYHSGKESIGVTVTLKNGKIEDVKVEEKAVSPISKKMQADFAANYKVLVVGKNIDEVKLGKVSGSSLTPIGFNTALEDIKTQASGS